MYQETILDHMKQKLMGFDNNAPCKDLMDLCNSCCEVAKHTLHLEAISRAAVTGSIIRRRAWLSEQSLPKHVDSSLLDAP